MAVKLYSKHYDEIEAAGKGTVVLWDRAAIGDLVLVAKDKVGNAPRASMLVRVEGYELHVCPCGDCDVVERAVVVVHHKPPACDYHAGYSEAGCPDCAVAA